MASDVPAGPPLAAGQGGPVLTLLSRAYCHLCDDMHDALAPLAQRHGASVVVIDIDAHPALESVHGDKVPVLFLGTPAEGTELCHYHLAPDIVDRALASFAR